MHSTVGLRIPAPRRTVTVPRRTTLDLEVETSCSGARSSFASPPDDPLDCSNSGTTMRLLAGVLAAAPFESVLRGRRQPDRTADGARRRSAAGDGRRRADHRRPPAGRRPRRAPSRDRAPDGRPERAGQERRPARRPRRGGFDDRARARPHPRPHRTGAGGARRPGRVRARPGDGPRVRARGVRRGGARRRLVGRVPRRGRGAHGREPCRSRVWGSTRPGRASSRSSNGWARRSDPGSSGWSWASPWGPSRSSRGRGSPERRSMRESFRW